MPLSGTTNSQKIWNWLKLKGLNEYACAGIIANLDAESGLNPNNLQDTHQSKLGFTDESYVSAVDRGVYTTDQFANDCAGFGLAQWTWHTRKRSLLNYTKSKGVSVSDLEAQLEFFYKELSENYRSLFQDLKTSTSVSDATVSIMLRYECPYDQSIAAQNRRVSIGQKYFDRFTSNVTEVVPVMGYLYYTKGQAVKVSDHFYSTEFDCHGSGCCNQTKVNERLPVHLEMIRNHFDAPVTITSPYRCPIHNSRPSVGGAPNSRHTKGDACDIVVKGVAPRTVAQYCESIGILGIGLYETKDDGYFVHIDERDYKSFWYGQSEQPRTTFGAMQGSQSTPSNSNNTSTLDTILNIGDSGQEVKLLQEKLIRLGYSCGELGADGDFGNNTYWAVRRFQEDAKIGVDGIAGHGTLTAIDAAIKKAEPQGATANYVGSKVSVTANLLNVRSGAGTNHGIVGQIKKGTLCTVTEDADGWCKIDSPVGWVSKEYITKV